MLEHVSLLHRGGADGGVRRRDGLREVDAHQPAARACTSRPPGTVFVDGVDVREIPLATLRGAIGFVPQEPFLFSDTIAENVAFGVPGGDAGDAAALAARVRAAAAVARLDKDVEDFPEGLRDGGRRARHHALRRPEAAHRARPGA